jgi:hypothetical protein
MENSSHDFLLLLLAHHGARTVKGWCFAVVALATLVMRPHVWVDDALLGLVLLQKGREGKGVLHYLWH